jgi:hypothetical protein
MRPVISGLCFLAAAAAFTAPAFAEGIAVPMDEVRIVTFKQPVTAVYLGNPAIADVTTIDSKRVFILGKTFGTTNLIALNADGKPVVNDPVTVFGRRMGAVTLNRGASQYSYTCTAAHCEAMPMPGDVPDYHKSTLDEITTHSDMSIKAASAQ